MLELYRVPTVMRKAMLHSIRRSFRCRSSERLPNAFHINAQFLAATCAKSPGMR